MRLAKERNHNMNEEVALLTTLMNESMDMCGLPLLTHKKTKAFVRANDVLKQLPIEQVIKLVDDYGLLLPAILLSDVNVDYGILLQDRTDLDVGGFITYMDVFLIRVTQNKKQQLQYFTQISDKAPKEIRRQYIKDALEGMINTKQKSIEQIVEDLINKEREMNDTDRRNL